MNKPAIKRLEGLIDDDFKRLALRLDEYHRLTVQEGGDDWKRSDNARKYVNRLQDFYDDFVSDSNGTFEYPKERADNSKKSGKTGKDSA